MADRLLREETVATFRLGFALDTWDALRTHFTAQGYTEQELMTVGLLSEREETGTRYDRFRGRLMIPIRDLDGRARRTRATAAATSADCCGRCRSSCVKTPARAPSSRPVSRGPVSYTHLDVYKRQVFACGVRKHTL